MKKKIKLILPILLVILLGAFLRFWRLPSRPVSLSIDEVAIGYNSYSILKTGRDEWGEFMPIAFRSIGDFKPPLLEYLMVPSIAVFGLTEFGTRFTVALIGTLTVLIVYLLTKELSKNKLIALFTSFSVAISPWHIQHSRMTHEAVVALFLVLTGVWLFLRSLKQPNKLFWLSAVFFALSLYTYHSERLFTPLFVLGLAIIFGNELIKKENKKAVLTAAAVGFILGLPFLKIMLGPKGSTRAINAFINKDVELNYQLHKPEEKLTFGRTILDGNKLMVFNFWTKRHLEYFDLPYLFFRGMKLSVPGAPGVGLLFLFELPFFLLGVWQVLVKKQFFERKVTFLLLFWLLLGPLPASVANNAQHPSRSLAMIPIPQLLVGVGLYYCWEKLKRTGAAKKVITKLITGLAVLVSLIYYLDIYHLHYQINFSEYWNYGMKEAALYAWDKRDDYEKIVIDSSFGTSGPFSVGTPHLYVYFYGKYDPRSLQLDPLHGQGPNRDSSDFLNFSFRPIYWPEDRYNKNYLFIGSPWSLPPDDLKNAVIRKIIPFKNGAIGFIIVESPGPRADVLE